MIARGIHGPWKGWTGLAISPPTRSPRILIVEDEHGFQTALKVMLGTQGLACDAACTLAEARSLIANVQFDIAIVDINLPDGSGLSLVGEIAPCGALVIVMTGGGDIGMAVEAIRCGADDFLIKPFSARDFLKRLEVAVDQWKWRGGFRGYARALETLVTLKAEELSRTSKEIDEIRDLTVQALGAALNLKDHETADHCRRVSENSVILGRALCLSNFELRNLKWGAYLHDVGKIGVPEQILLKEGKLLPEEVKIMQRHPIMGHSMVRNIDFLRFATDVVLYHHERYDGSGYPHGLGGDQIPLNARIFSVLDTVDAMTSDRPYRNALSISSATQELSRFSGKMYDPEVVEAFVALPQTTWSIQERGMTQKQNGAKEI